MIESNIIKRYIIKSFMQHSHLPITDITEKIICTLNCRLLINESVVVKSTGETGKVAKCAKNSFSVVFGSGEEKTFEYVELSRKHSPTFADISTFLENITIETAFGRILVENIFDLLSEPGFGSVPVRPGAAKKPEKTAPKKKETLDRGQLTLNTMDVLKKSQSGIDSNISSHLEELSNFKKAQRSATGGMPRAVPQPPAPVPLDFKSLEKIKIENFEDAELKRLVKINMFLMHFSKELGIDKISLEVLGEWMHSGADELAEPLSALVALVEMDGKTRKERFYDSLKLLLGALPEYETGLVAPQLRKIGKITQENWKTQGRVFLQNLSVQCDSERVLRLCEFSKKDEQNLRLEFFELLIDML
ncbi:hypothetical protein ENBRE01_3422, partial [Enteropsectra breve]